MQNMMNAHAGAVLLGGMHSGQTSLGGPVGRDTNEPQCSEVSHESTFLEYQTDRFETYEAHGCSLLVRGYCLSKPHTQLNGQDNVARKLLERYLREGCLLVEDLDGCFTLVLRDSRKNQIHVFRNLGDPHFLYYCESVKGHFFGDHPTRVASAAGIDLQPCGEALPSFFLYRFVPGRATLFEGIHRLLPGELLTLDSTGMRVGQYQTLQSLGDCNAAAPTLGCELDDVFHQIVTDYATIDAEACVLLSGGVDSSYIQAHWNNCFESRTSRKSIAISTDHAVGNMEREYALEASRLLNTTHVEVRFKDRYAATLAQAIAISCEPPNHVQTPYFLTLASAMREQGALTGICGQGADALFGSYWGDCVYRARWIRRFMPAVSGRRLLHKTAVLLRRQHWAFAVQLSDRLQDYSWIEHPVNQHDTFGHWPSVTACFGRGSLVAACHYRQALLEQQGVTNDVLRQVNEIAFLGDTYDTCSLWNSLFSSQGIDMLFPFLDSRLLKAIGSLRPELRFAYRSPKQIIKAALCKHVPSEFVYRKKLSFAQPIYKWLAPDGILAYLVDRIAPYDFVDKRTLAEAKGAPNSFLYCLLCYDLWHKIHILKADPRDVVKQAD